MNFSGNCQPDLYQTGRFDRVKREPAQRLVFGVTMAAS